VFRSHLVLVKGAGAEEHGSTFTGLFLAEDSKSHGVAVRVSDEPARGRDVTTLCRDVLEMRASRMTAFRQLRVGPATVLGHEGGLERRFIARMGDAEVPMFERYLVLGDRAFVLVAPEPGRPVADTVGLTPPVLPGAKYFEPCLTMPIPEGWTISERVVLAQARSGHQVTADHVVTAVSVGLQEWRDRQVAALMRQLPGAQVTSAAPARVLGRLDGGQVVIRSTQGRKALITSLWLAVSGDRDAYYVTVSVRDREQAIFGPLSTVAV
jgi:hypothetical protein